MRICTCERFTANQPFDIATDCRLCWLNFHDASYRAHWAGKPQPLGTGPGTELKKLLAELGITDLAGCGCEKKSAQMNRWGVEGCRENFARIRGWIAEAQKKAGWLATITAATRAATSGLALQIDLTDVAGSLALIAIERAAKTDA